MGLLETLERLINEHASAAVLREHVALLRDEKSTLERQVADLKAQNQALKAQDQQQAQQIRMLQQQMQNAPPPPNPRGYACDHCGSIQLRRTGARPDPVFGRLGAKQALFVCEACQGQSAFSEDPT